MTLRHLRSWLAGAAAPLTAPVCVQGPASAADGRPCTNPLKSMEGADPWLESYDGNYYLVTTTFTDVLGMRKSHTLAGLATAPSVQIWSE